MPTLATQKCDSNYGNNPDMINAFLTATRLGKALRNELGGFSKKIIPDSAIVHARD